MSVEEMRLYVDATIIDEENHDARLYGVFGPFSERCQAERCLVGLAGRANVITAVLREPMRDLLPRRDPNHPDARRAAGLEPIRPAPEKKRP